ncbi:MAG: hypothetical protein F4Y14_08085 [Acidobacteria bacterium]|nr:hypothetical protein [Acidobacteriota bacterium]MYH71448.1 hypothetical protein [Acidimicrobiia bacterium]
MPGATRTHLQPFLTPTGAVTTVEGLRTGDTVLVWTRINPEAPNWTWGAVAPSNSSWPTPVNREDFKVEEAVICRLDEQWHTTSARRGIALGTVVSTRPHYGDGPPAWPDGTVDVSLPRADLVDGLSLACIDIEHGAPFNLDADEWPLDDRQLKHFNDAARLTGRHLASIPWPSIATALGDSARQFLPEKLRLWRDKGMPLHIRTLRRLAQEHGAAPHPDETAIHDLQHLLRAGDQLDVYTRADAGTGLAAHATGIGADSGYPAYVAEVDSQWWYSAYNRGTAVGTHLACTDNDTVLAAVTDDDFQASIALARADHHLDGTQRDQAARALAALQHQYDDICSLNADICSLNADTIHDRTAVHLAANYHCAYQLPRAAASHVLGL